VRAYQKNNPKTGRRVLLKLNTFGIKVLVVTYFFEDKIKCTEIIKKKNDWRSETIDAVLYALENQQTKNSENFNKE